MNKFRVGQRVRAVKAEKGVDYMSVLVGKIGVVLEPDSDCDEEGYDYRVEFLRGDSEFNEAWYFMEEWLEDAPDESPSLIYRYREQPTVRKNQEEEITRLRKALQTISEIQPLVMSQWIGTEEDLLKNNRKQLFEAIRIAKETLNAADTNN